MNKIITLPLILLLFSTVILAQDSIPPLPKPTLEMTVKRDSTKQPDPWELGLVFGGGYYLGDLLSLGSVKLNTFKPGGALFLRNNVSHRFSLRFQAMYTGISGNGSNLVDSYEPVTSFSFKSTIFESSILLEWDFLGAKRFPSKGGFKKVFSPYIFVGAGVASSWTTPRYPNNRSGAAANIT
ncbi:MAG: DUF6089 family protein, partial [Saprospiraceae bacterium]|nr:DUF6089 family protein [Saprospiraceae bacterium]